MALQHDPQRHRFFVDVPGGTAELTYRRPDPKTVELLHTEVPEAAAGQGLGGKLAESAFVWARGEGLRVIPTCPFVRKWLERHPGESDLVLAGTGAK